MDDDTFGGIAAVGDYVFATDDQTGEQTAAERGIVRYNLVTETFERFHADADDPIDITVGLDGLLYTLSPVTAPIGTIVRQYHPQTMGLLAEITLPASHRAIAVDANGDIFAVSPEIHHYNSAGVQVQPPLGDGGIGGLSDVDMDRDGRLLVAAQDGHVLLTDRRFTGLVSFLTRASDGRNFAAFVSPSRGAVRAVWDTFTVPVDSTDVPLHVLANDELSSVGAPDDHGGGVPDRGGQVALAGNTLLRYTPATDFVGRETFSYTTSDGLGGSDQGLVVVTVEGQANFTAVDDRYDWWDGAREDFPLFVGTTGGVLANDGQLDIFPVLTPGNILVAHSPVGIGRKAVLQEYTPGGTLVRSVPLPDFAGGPADVRDLVLDRNGRVQIYNGTYNPRLTTFDPVTGLLTNTPYANWNTNPVATYGGLASWRNFIFAADQYVPSVGDTTAQQGIVRFDVNTATVDRPVTDGDFIDLSVGLNGSLYALGPGDLTAAKSVRVYNPQSMGLIRVVTGSIRRRGRSRSTPPAGSTRFGRRTRGCMSTIRKASFSRPRLRHGPAGRSRFQRHRSERGRMGPVDRQHQSEQHGESRDCDLVVTTIVGGAGTRLQAPDEISDMKFAAWVQRDRCLGCAADRRRLYPARSWPGQRGRRRVLHLHPRRGLLRRGSVHVCGAGSGREPEAGDGDAGPVAD